MNVSRNTISQLSTVFLTTLFEMKLRSSQIQAVFTLTQSKLQVWLSALEQRFLGNICRKHRGTKCAVQLSKRRQNPSYLEWTTFNTWMFLARVDEFMPYLLGILFLPPLSMLLVQVSLKLPAQGKFFLAMWTTWTTEESRMCETPPSVRILRSLLTLLNQDSSAFFELVFCLTIFLEILVNISF